MVGAKTTLCQGCGGKRGQTLSCKLPVITVCHHSLGNDRTSGEWSQEQGAYSRRWSEGGQQWGRGKGNQIRRTGHEAPQYTIAGCFIKSH